MRRSIWRGRVAARVALSVSTILAGTVALPAFAQAPPPVRPSVDGNGVDLFTGTLAVEGPALTIGSGDRGMSYYHLFRNGGWTDNLVAAMTISGSTVTVTFGGVTDRFTGSGGAYTATEGRGSTLTLSGGIYTYTASDGTVAHFSTSRTGFYPSYATGARVTDIASPNGETLTFSYDSLYYCSGIKQGANGPICTLHSTTYRLATVDNRYGYRATFSYPTMDVNDPNDPETYPYDVTTWSTPTGVTLLNRATNGSVSGNGFSNNAGQSASYGYSASGITSITRPGSSSANVTIGYSGGRVSSVTTAAGTVGYAASDSGGVRTVTVTNPASQTTSYTFNIASSRMTSVTDATSRTTSYTYDTSGRLTRTTMPEGNYVDLTLDARGNVTTTTAVAKSGSGQANIVTSATYPCTVAVSCNQPTTTTDARGNVTDYIYDSTHGGVTNVKAPAPTSGAVRPETRYSYTAITNSVTGAAVYQLTGVSACRTTASCTGTADETKTTIAYETGNLLPTSTTVAAGNGSLSATTSVGYDAIGNVTTVDGPLAGTADTTRTLYDANRRPTAVISADPDGAGALPNRMVKTTYDAQGRPTVQETGTSDANGNSFAVAQTVTTAFNTVDQKISEVLSAGGTEYAKVGYGYDAAGRQICSARRMDPAQWGSQTDYCAPQTTGPNGPDRVEQRGYDAAGRLTIVASAFGTSQLSYTNMAYTANGQIASMTDGENNKTANTYDGHDRLVKVNYPVTTQGAQAANTGDYEQYTLDAAGNVTNKRLRDGQSIGYTYDALNRVKSKTVPTGGPVWQASLTYSYDLFGNMTQASRADGHYLNYAYNALGQATSSTSVIGGTTSYLYDAAGRRTRLTWNDGNYVGYDYLVTGEMSAIRNSSGTALVTLSYDALGRRTSLARANGTATSYAYDAASRLQSLGQDLSGTTSDVTTTFTYNPASQIASRTGTNDGYAWTGHYNVNRSYGVNGLNQTTSAGSTSITYDGRGNLATSGSTSYGYSVDNLLATVSGATSLAYDPAGRLLQDAGNTTTRFDYAGNNLIAEYDSSNVLQRRYVYGPGADEALIWFEGGGLSSPRYLHADERGSVVAVGDASGATLAINRYDEYGIPAATNLGRFQYTGQAWLPQAGLYYYKARMYSPTLGRFMQTDPIGYGDGMNWYNYVGSDPVNLTDPTGLMDYRCDRNGNCTDSGGNKVDPKTKLKPGDTVSTSKGTYFEGIAGDHVLSTNNGYLAYSGSSGARLTGEAAQKSAERTVQAFWTRQASEGNPIAHLGMQFGIDSKKSFDVGFSSARLYESILLVHPTYSDREARSAYSSIRVLLVSGDVLSRLQDRSGVRGLLSAGQIYDYHVSAFSRFDVPSWAFGGSLLTGTRTEAIISAKYIGWCKGCDKQ